MSFPTPRLLPLAIAAMAACSSALAGGYTSPDGKFSLSGFGTLGAVTTDNDDVRFQYPGQADGAQKSPNLGVDSKIALQGTYKFLSTVSATAQVMSKQNAEGDYTPNFEWIFAKWQATPGLSFRAGRTAAPLFMISDFREVGYANVFVRPPLEVYGQVPYSSVDGADATLQHSFGPVTLTGQLWGGTAKNKYGSLAADGSPALSQVEVKNQIGLNLTAEVDGGWSFRAGHNKGKMTITSSRFTPILAGAAQLRTLVGLYGAAPNTTPVTQIPGSPQLGAVKQYASQLAQAASIITVNEVDATFSGVGFSLDKDSWFTSAEFTKRTTKSYVSDSTGWYVIGGMRFGKFSPYVGYAKLKVDSAPISNPLTSPLALAASPNAVSGVTNIIAGQNFGQHTQTIGVRWDALSSLAVKAQLDVVKPDAEGRPGAGLFTGVKSTYNGKAVNVLTLSVDFVF